MKINKEKINKFIKNLINRILNHEITTMASSMSYYYLSAALPLLLILTSLISKYLKGNEKVLFEMIYLMPEPTQNIIIPMINSLLNSSKVATMSIVTLLFAVWSASKGISSLLESINKAYSLEYKRSAVLKKIISFGYTALLVFIIILLMILRIYGPRIAILIKPVLEQISIYELVKQFSWLFALINGFLPLVVVVIALSLIYKSAPDSDENFKVSFKESLIGGVFASFAIILVSIGYSFFLKNLSNMSAIYGALTGFISLFLWLLIFSYSIILGAEIIAAYKEIKETSPKTKNKEKIDEK